MVSSALSILLCCQPQHIHFCLLLKGCNKASTAPTVYEMTGRKRWERKFLNRLLSSGWKIFLEETSRRSAAERLIDQAWAHGQPYLQRRVGERVSGIFSLSYGEQTLPEKQREEWLLRKQPKVYAKSYFRRMPLSLKTCDITNFLRAF